MQEVIIIGAGGNSKVIVDLINAINDSHQSKKQVEPFFKISGILDDDKAKKHFEGYPVLGEINKINTLKADLPYGFINGIGDNQTRKSIFLEYKEVNWITVSHPTAIISKNVKVGTGSVIMAGAIINSGTVIGKQALINTGTIIEHDNIISDFAHLASGTVTAGGVNVGEASMLGTGTKIIQGISIGKNTMIGAGAVVISDIPSNCTAVGVPAKVIKTNNK